MQEKLETIKILSSTFVHLSGVIRDLINLGNYILYAIDYPDVPAAKYILSSGQDLLLTEAGAVISVCPKCANITYKYIVKFSDIPIYQGYDDSEVFRSEVSHFAEYALQD